MAQVPRREMMAARGYMPFSGASAGTTVTLGPVAHGAADRAWRISPGVVAVGAGLFLAHVVDVSSEFMRDY